MFDADAATPTVSNLTAAGQVAVYSDAAPIDIAVDVVGFYPTGADLVNRTSQ